MSQSNLSHLSISGQENLLTQNGEQGLLSDTSIEDVNTSIAGLASGDGALAGRGYERLVSRWRKVVALESAT